MLSQGNIKEARGSQQGKHDFPGEFMASDPYPETLQQAEQAIKSALQEAKASPFIAHVELEYDLEKDAKHQAEIFAHQSYERLERLLEIYPAFGTWFIATKLASNYGEADAGDDGHGVHAAHAVYLHIQKLVHALEQPTANEVPRLNKTFRDACQKLNLALPELPEKGSRSNYVMDYLTQAGVSDKQLSYLAHVFVKAKRMLGSVPIDDTTALNEWEDDAVRFDNVHSVLRRIIDADVTGYHALVFAHLDEGGTPRSKFECKFLEEIETAKLRVSADIGDPLPALCWRDVEERLAIAAKASGYIHINGRRRPLARGHSVPILPPWPNQVTWESKSGSKRDIFLLNRNSVEFFDEESGRCLSAGDPASRSRSLDSTSVVVLARQPFLLDEEESTRIDKDAHMHRADLVSSSSVLTMNGMAMTLRMREKPRILLEDTSGLQGPKFRLLGTDAVICVHWPHQDHIKPKLHWETYENNGACDLEFDSHSMAHISLTALIGDISGPPMPLHLYLVKPGFESKQVKRKCWVWPKFKIDQKYGFTMPAPAIEKAFDTTHSRHAFCDDGCLKLDASKPWDKAVLALRCRDDLGVFYIPRPGRYAALLGPDGRHRPLTMGETITMGGHLEGTSILIQPSDKDVDLRVRGELYSKAFERLSKKIIPLSIFVGSAGNNRIEVGDEGADDWIVVADIVPVSMPKKFSIEKKGGRLHIDMQFDKRLDAIRIDAENEFGEKEMGILSCSHRYAGEKTPPWLQKHNDGVDLHRVEFSISPSSARGGGASSREIVCAAQMGKIFVSFVGEDEWRPLVDDRGHVYAIGWNSYERRRAPHGMASVDASDSFLILSEQLAVPIQSQCWAYVRDTIFKRWRAVGQDISDRLECASTFLEAAGVSCPKNAPRSWMPKIHPLYVKREMYGIHACSMAKHFYGFSEKPLKRVQDDGRIAGHFLVGFMNKVDADRKDVPLRNFNFSNYAEAIGDADLWETDFWNIEGEKDFLSAEHHAKAMRCFADRLIDAGFDDANADNNPLPPATTAICVGATRYCEGALMVEEGVVSADMEVIRRAPTFFSTFAREARNEKVGEFLEILAKDTRMSSHEIVSAVIFLLRLGPELLEFYLLLWELVRLSKDK